MMLMRFKPSPLPSPLPGVSDEAWTKFVRALDVQDSRAVSVSGGYGAYDFRPRRLVELGVAGRLPAARDASGRQVQCCDFPGVSLFLGNPKAQLSALRHSSRLYCQQIMSGEIAKPEGISLAGALAILHRGGRGALAGWPKLFTDTQALYDAAQGVF